jgi:8-oxo-dGTP pyrophosphatase MutT (NUDIX family)
MADSASYQRRIAAAAIIFDDDRRVLLVKQGYGECLWDIPAGAGQPGEAAQETAIRELREEAGIEAEPRYMTGVYHHEPSDTHDFVFVCERVDRQAPAPQPPETTECDFFSLDALPAEMTTFTRQRIEDAIHAVRSALPKRAM